MKFEVSQRQQIASGKRRIFGGAPYQKQASSGVKTPLTLSALAPFTIFCIPLTRNLSPAAPSPCSEGGPAFQRQLPPAFQRWPSLFWQFEKFGTRNALLRYGIDTRCQKRLPPVRDAFSDAFGVKNRLFWYGHPFFHLLPSARQQIHPDIFSPFEGCPLPRAKEKPKTFQSSKKNN